MRFVIRTRALERPAALLARTLLVALGASLACGTSVLPVTGAPCATDEDCDPGDSCIGGSCQGSSAGGDAGVDAGGADAGPGDAGPDAGDAGSDAGPPAGGVLTLTPLTSAISLDAGVAPAPVALTVGNRGTATLHWSASCTGGASPSPGGAALDAGANATLSVSLPTWTVGGSQSLGCAVDTSDAVGGPLQWSLSASVAGAPAHVGLDGGAVDLLDFSFTGDTRPPDCDNASGGSGPYPQATFESELSEMVQLGPQFGFDLGDHMYVCSGSLANAQAQLKLYTDALAARWPAALPFFMTMGNHECGKKDCSGTNKNDPNFVAYSAALQSVSQQSHPYYSFQVQTRLGRASFLFISDNYDSAPMQAWLASALADADANSAYTFIIKHYPVTGSRQGPADIEAAIAAHHYSLLLTAHEHDYAHDTTTAPWNGRSVICGLGGANATAGDQGFCRVQQQPDGSLLFTEYMLGGNPADRWSVSARQ